MNLGVLENVLHGLDGSCSPKPNLRLFSTTADLSNMSSEPSPAWGLANHNSQLVVDQICDTRAKKNLSILLLRSRLKDNHFVA